jgi:hypothetical protein
LKAFSVRFTADETMTGWLKVLAVCSALMLGGGYVWVSQQKSADRRKEVERRSMLPSSKSKVVVEEAGPYDGRFPPFDGAEGAKDSRTNADFISPVLEETESRTILPGSKSGLVLPPEDEEKQPEKRTILPGSKSIGPLLSPDDKKDEP